MALGTAVDRGNRLDLRGGLGDLVFVEMSQVRESAAFSGILITERLSAAERTCGVCVIDLTRGKPIALLRFEESV